MKRWMMTVLILCATASAAQAKLVSRMIDFEHEGTALQGYLVYDDAVSGTRPGILVAHEWWGLNDYARHRADQLAEMGYVAFATDMYGKGKVTEHPEEAMEWSSTITKNIATWQARARLGLDILAKDEHVDPDRLAAVGYCFGGATVLELAFSGAPVRGVASFHGSLPVPDPETIKGMTAKLLICHGAADGFTPPEKLAEFVKALNDAGVDWEMDMYGGAVHSFTVKGAEDRGIPGLAYNAEADARSWARMQAFFAEIFGPVPVK